MAFNLNKLVQPECGASNPLVATAHQIAMMRPSTSGAVQANANLQSSISAASTMAATMCNEFRQQEALPQLLQSKLSMTNKTGPMIRNIPVGIGTQLQQSQQQMTNVFYTQQALQQQQQQQQQHNLNQQQASFVSAGDQLETKYRNDMINSQKVKDEGKVDDIEFWQGLSQSFIGPTTFSTTSRASTSKTVEQSEPTTSTKTSIDQDKKTTEILTDPISEAEIDSEIPLTKSELRAHSKQDLEYTFEDRNPFLGQHADPFAEGLKALERDDIPSAALLFEAAVQKNDKDPVAWRYLGTTQAQNEQDLLAIKALRNCLVLDPTDQAARLAIAPSLVNENYSHETCKNLLEWLINHDKYKSLGASLEMFYALDNQMDDMTRLDSTTHRGHYLYVREQFINAARASPDMPDPDVQNMLGVLLNMDGAYTEAVDCFKSALSVNENDSLLWNRLGATLANGNKPEEAVVAYRRALELSPGFIRSRYNLAISLIHLNCYEEAAKQLVLILNTQAAGKGSGNVTVRTRSITSRAIWNTLRTVATLMNKPNLYPFIDGKNLDAVNLEIFGQERGSAD